MKKKKLSVAQTARAFHQTLQSLRGSWGTGELDDWEDTSEHNREMGCKFIREVMKNPQITAEAHHDKWVAEMAMRGYRNGDVRDHNAKTHPFMVPWEDLEHEDRVEAMLMVNMAKILLPLISDDDAEDEEEADEDVPPSPGRRNGLDSPTGRSLPEATCTSSSLTMVAVAYTNICKRT